MRHATALILVGSIAIAPEARADTTIHASGGASVAYNDNIQGAPDEPPAGVVAPIADFSVAISPGLTLLYAAHRWELTLAYSRAFVFFVDHPEVDASADQLAAATTIVLSRRDDLQLTLGVNRQATNLSTLGQPSSTTAQAQPLGNGQLLRVSASQGYGHDYSDTLSVDQLASASFTTPVSASPTQPSTLVLDVGAGPTWLSENHVLAAQLGILHARSFALASAGLAENDQVTPRLWLRWRWEFASRWSTEARAGAAVPFDLSANAMFVPLAGAGLYYAFEGYFASLEYSRNVNANVTTGQSYESDNGSLSGSVPLWPEAALSVEGALGLAHNRLVDSSLQGQTVAINNWVVDGGLRWGLPNLPLSLSLRFQHLQQFGASENQTRLFDFTRNAGTLTLDYFIPERNPRRAPRQPNRGQPTNVDTDSAPE